MAWPWGEAAFILILEYVSLEKSVDKFHAKIEQTYLRPPMRVPKAICGKSIPGMGGSD
ncbi:MAG: hypothetical protein IPJ13_02170 [Saprospiraceae bacterium]|nr:hypothetical protein [Saprospiraceae bacterium]